MSLDKPRADCLMAQAMSRLWPNGKLCVCAGGRGGRSANDSGFLAEVILLLHSGGFQRSQVWYHVWPALGAWRTVD